VSDYIEDKEVDTIARDLITKYPELLGHIDPDRLLFTREISRSQKSRPGNCRPVKPPFNLLNPDILYIVVVYFKAGWDDKTPAQRTALVAHQLLHISPEFDGSVLQHDVADWSFLIDNLGSDYLSNGQVADLRRREDGMVEDLDAEEVVDDDGAPS